MLGCVGFDFLLSWLDHREACQGEFGCYEFGVIAMNLVAYLVVWIGGKLIRVKLVIVKIWMLSHFTFL